MSIQKEVKKKCKKCGTEIPEFLYCKSCFKYEMDRYNRGYL